MADPTEIKGVVERLQNRAAQLRLVARHREASLDERAATLLTQEHEARVRAEAEREDAFLHIASWRARAEAASAAVDAYEDAHEPLHDRVQASEARVETLGTIVKAVRDWDSLYDALPHGLAMAIRDAPQAAEARSLSAEGLVAELVEGLRPFADALSELDDGDGRPDQAAVHLKLGVPKSGPHLGDFRKLQALLLKVQQFQDGSP